MEELSLIQTSGLPILEQLHLEEALLRTSARSWFLLNVDPPRAIAMGISTRPEEVVNLKRVVEDGIPLIRRYSGGGTVVLDKGSLMMTFIGSPALLKGAPLFPERILRWTGAFYAKALQLPGFAVESQDYVIGKQKCGGNAQYISRQRWVHHTSFLYDWSPQAMSYLKMPPRMPAYRQARPHEAFLTKLKEHSPSPTELIKKVEQSLAVHFRLTHLSLEEARSYLLRPHRRSTTLLYPVS